jgi:DNA mismatch repair protein MutL
MQDIIQILPNHIANQIAAGEVIQRPASVIKELIENAIDARASQIDIIIKDAGRTLIQVVDNGIGMSPMDARMAFERHATSKVKSADDLFALYTKGFRGEALASIAAIAHVELLTKQENKDIGTKIQIEGSKIINQEQIVCKKGSSLLIKNLFFNVPARRNFLKSDAVEFKHIEEEFKRVVLAHPDINFTLIHNESTLFSLQQANFRKRIIDVFGKSYNEKLIPIEENTGIVEIHGFIGKPEAAKKSRGEQFFFVNDRFFKDHYFNHAVTSAFENLLIPKTFPSYFLYFRINPSSIDVNVHPTKTEIKFEEEKEIYAILKSAIKLGLGKFNITPTLDFEQETSFDLPYADLSKTIVEPKITVNPNYNPFHSFSSTKSYSNSSSAINKAGFNSEYTSKDWENFYSIEEEDSHENKLEIEEKHNVDSFLIFNNYIFFSERNGITGIQYKRAKERILYDSFMNTFIHKPLNSQQLLFPYTFTCLDSIKYFWKENKQTIERFGFLWKETMDGIEITGIPSEISNDTIHEFIELLNEKFTSDTIDKNEIAHEIALNLAKSESLQKQTWNLESVNLLLESLFECKEHSYSPSGKKIIDTFTLEEILKKI